MATFTGYSTINQYKNYTVTDFDLIKRDLLNALTIRQGEMPGRPNVGTTMFTLIFEPQGEPTNKAIIKEIQRVVAQDPRIQVADVNVYPQENGILIELEVDTVSGQQGELLNIFFNNETMRAAYSDV
jgi:phage baseplate assembly protein W|tara:strand:+ start:5260 stop:5640 length:381 start_codon:yes stop_codon:yes gene_type:complete